MNREQLSVWRQLRKMDRASIMQEIRNAMSFIVILGVCLPILAYSALALLHVRSNWVAITTLVLAAVVGAASGFWHSIKTMLELGLRPEDPAERLKRRIRRVNEAFADAATLLDELRRDLEAQQIARERILAEAEHQQGLLELNRDEAEKIGKLITGETQATIRAGRRRDWMFFVLGIAVSVPVGILVNHIS